MLACTLQRKPDDKGNYSAVGTELQHREEELGIEMAEYSTSVHTSPRGRSSSLSEGPSSPMATVAVQPVSEQASLPRERMDSATIGDKMNSVANKSI